MVKTAFVFPGQGAQYIGMAMDYMEKHAEVKQILLDFDLEHKTDLYHIMQDGPEELLKETRYTQPAILFHSIAAWEGLRHACHSCEGGNPVSLVPDFVAGHSLGEFTALVANGVLSLKDAMHIVHKRGEFMIKAVGEIPFAMAAIIGLEAELVVEICAEAEKHGLVKAVNFNTPIQTVISGTKEGVEAAGELAKAKGAKRVLPLIVGGPFHTPLIAQASLWLREEMLTREFKPAAIPVVSNVDALPETNPIAIRDKLVKQIISPVRWVECIQFMLSKGVTRFVEFGPQKVLSGMIKNIDKEALVLNVDKLEDIAAVKEALFA